MSLLINVNTGNGTIRTNSQKKEHPSMIVRTSVQGNSPNMYKLFRIEKTKNSIKFDLRMIMPMVTL